VPLEIEQRISKRLPCALRVDGRRYSGVVLNVSQGGLFVQTSALPERGESVALELSAPEAERAIPVDGKVAWRRVVPHQLRSMARGGVGVQIQHADESYYVLLARWMRTELPVPERPSVPAPTAPAPEALTWRVRIRALEAPRTRTLTVEAPSAEEARQEALRHSGEGWRVIEIDAL
jgi:Tfp pilus assembly protein PilZ